MIAQARFAGDHVSHGPAGPSPTVACCDVAGAVLAGNHGSAGPSLAVAQVTRQSRLDGVLGGLVYTGVLCYSQAIVTPGKVSVVAAMSSRAG